MKYNPIVPAALLLFACATTKTHPASEPEAPSASDELVVPDSQLPNGVMKSCRVIQREVEAAGKQMLIMQGGAGIFLLPLPEASDWKFQCDDEKPFWGFSKSGRMQVSVTPHRTEPDADLTLRNYLTAIGANMKAGVESEGLQVSGLNVSKIHTGDRSEVYGLEMMFEAPEGHALPLFPQNTFFTARQVAKNVMLDVHLTTYPRDGTERASLRSTARVVMGSFSVNVRGLE